MLPRIRSLSIQFRKDSLFLAVYRAIISSRTQKRAFYHVCGAVPRRASYCGPSVDNHSDNVIHIKPETIS